MSKAEYRSAVRSRQLINAALADLLQEKALEKIISMSRMFCSI